ncbi:MAG: hypothetical protein R3C19_23090 [Planctomycetaceae bacterium]
MLVTHACRSAVRMVSLVVTVCVCVNSIAAQGENSHFAPGDDNWVPQFLTASLLTSDSNGPDSEAESSPLTVRPASCGATCDDDPLRPIGDLLRVGPNDNCCFANACCDPCQTWTASVGAVFVHRAMPKFQPLISDPAAPGAGLNAADFNPGWAAGMDLGLTRHRAFDSATDLEFRFFNVDDWSDSRTLRLNGNPLVIHTNPQTFVTGGRDVTSVYSSRLMSVEANARRCIGSRTTLLYGLRYMQLNERLLNRLTSGPGVGDILFTVAADNDLIGLQTGLVCDLLAGCDCCVQFYGKAGLYLNDAGQFSSLTNFSAPATTFTANGDQLSVAGSGEFGIVARRRLCNNLSLQAGYHVLGLHGVATAPGQLSRSGFLTGTGLDRNDTVMFHGASLQLLLAY